MTTWEDIGNPAASGSRNPTTDDVGYYLRATAMYTDKHGSGKTASVISENAVETRTSANARPDFSDLDTDDETAGTQVARIVDENAKGAQVGKPISAKDDDAALLYSLAGNPANADVDETDLFGINERTGQITTKVALDANAAGDTDVNEVTYTVTVTAKDPSGASASQDVVITVNNVNDAPAFDTEGDDADPTTLWVNENTTVLRTVDAVGGATLGGTVYAATDDDEADPPSDGDLDLFVGGADGDMFSLSDDGELAFDDHTPNYEKQKSYSITLMVEDDEFALGTLDVTVNVRNAEDPGEVELNAREPQIDRAVLATLTDEDGTIRGQEWQWERANSALSGADTCADIADGAWSDISGATSPSYTPKAEDVPDDGRRCIRATVDYTDGFVTDTNPNDDIDDDGDEADMESERPVQESDPANTAPEFDKDQDPNTPGDQEVAEREVPENMKTTVGNAIVAEDDDLLMYSVDDDTNFSVDGNGQISTKVELDFETQSEYMVTLMAMDPSGAYDTVMVQITVTDGPDEAVITAGAAVNTAPAFGAGTATRQRGREHG